MKHNFLFVLGFLILVSCNLKHNQIDDTQKPLIEPVNRKKNIQLKIKINDRQVIIHQIDSNKIILPDRLIYNLKESIFICSSCYSLGKNIDTIVDITLDKEGSITPFELIDINFDGFLDIRFPNEGSCCSGNNVFYDTWIYDSQANNFNYQPVLSQMPIWNISKEDKTVTTGWHMSAYRYGSTKYGFKDGEMIPIFESQTEAINDTLMKTITKKLLNNIWIKDSIIHGK